MLKLDLSSDAQNEASIKLSNQEPFLTKQLIRAFGLAVLFHLVCFVAFRVESAQAPIEAIHKPVVVGLVPGINPSSGTSHQLRPRLGIAPRRSDPDFPEFYSRSFEVASSVTRPQSPLERTFASLEALPYYPGAAGFHFIQHHRPIRLHLSGPLADCRLVDDGLGDLNLAQERIEPIETYQALFDVQLDNRTGELFDVKLVRDTGDPELDRLALAIIHSIRFEALQVGLTTLGHVELRFELGAGLSIAALSNLQQRD